MVLRSLSSSKKLPPVSMGHLREFQFGAIYLGEEEEISRRKERKSKLRKDLCGKVDCNYSDRMDKLGR